jgi:hypothetical protein
VALDAADDDEEADDDGGSDRGCFSPFFVSFSFSFFSFFFFFLSVAVAAAVAAAEAPAGVCCCCCCCCCCGPAWRRAAAQASSDCLFQNIERLSVSGHKEGRSPMGNHKSSRSIKPSPKLITFLVRLRRDTRAG